MITKEQVEYLCKNTNYGLFDCSKALKITNGNVEEAYKLLTNHKSGMVLTYKIIKLEEEIKVLKEKNNTNEKLECYVIYCVNNSQNFYMDYAGERCPFSRATIFKDIFEAHSFLREKGANNNFYRWIVINVNDLKQEQIEWRN